MTKEEMITLLNGDLANERMHRDFYLWASSVCTGPDRLEGREFFTKAAESEMKHIQEFQDVIVGLGGDVCTNTATFPTGDTWTRILLQIALQIEDDVVAAYAERIGQAEELGGVDGKYLEIFLEEQLLDSRTDADNIRQMVIC